MKNKSHPLLLQIDRLHTTTLGADRIRRNLSLSEEDAVLWCAEKICQENSEVLRQGKNWYITVDGCVITVNVNSCTIITAHKQAGV